MSTSLRNPHLEGDSFTWSGGPVGVLLIHGYTATTAEVRLLAGYLHERGYTVSGPLLPGHGTTPREMNRCRWQDWVAACDQAYTALASRCERVFVGGESMGGLLALQLASRHPEIVGIMCYAAALKLPYSFQRQYLLPFLAQFVPYLPKGLGQLSAADARWQGYDQHPLRATQQLLALQKETLEKLCAVAQPALIVQGRLDTAVDASAPDLIAAGISSTDKEVHWFDNSMHCVLLDQEWEDAAALTLQFMERVLSSDRR